MSRFGSSRRALQALLITSSVVVTAGLAASPLSALSPEASAEASIRFLARVMDRSHDRVPVYEDVSSAGNHFVAIGAIPDANAAVTINGSWADNPHSGATALRFEFQDVPGANFAGIYLLNGILPNGASAPLPNFGTVAGAGFDLSGATTPRFWARGQTGGEEIAFFVAGVGWNPATVMPVEPFPDSSPRHPGPGTITTLTSDGQRYAIDVSGLDLFLRPGRVRPGHQRQPAPIRHRAPSREAVSAPEVPEVQGTRERTRSLPRGRRACRTSTSGRAGHAVDPSACGLAAGKV